MIIGPKIEAPGKLGVRFHAKEKPRVEGGSEWYYEERECQLAPTSMLLVRVLVGKVEQGDRLKAILRSIPIRQGQPGWNCVGWIKEALEKIKADGRVVGTSVLDWETVDKEAMAYCQRKKDQHRFDGQGNFDTEKAPTYDLIQRKEVIV